MAYLSLVRGDPSNLCAIRHVRLVIAGGVLYDPARLYRAAGIVPF